MDLCGNVIRTQTPGARRRSEPDFSSFLKIPPPTKRKSAIASQCQGREIRIVDMLIGRIEANRAETRQ